MKAESIRKFLKQKSADITVQAYLINTLRAMAFGLLASLFIGTIFGALGQQLGIGIFNVIADYTKSTTGAALGIVIAHVLKVSWLVLFSAATVEIAGSILDGPIGALVAIIIAVELGRIVSRETRLGVTITPRVIIVSGILMVQFVGPDVVDFMNWLGSLVKTTTEMQSFIMGTLVSVLIEIVLTLPISSAAIRIALFLDGLVGGAAAVGCCVQMVGSVAMSCRENGINGLMTQGLGTSMLQMGNTVLNPRIWIPPTLASMITGPITAAIFDLKNIPADSGTGTCGLVGSIGVYTTMGGGVRMWLGILLVCSMLLAALTFIFGEILRRMG